MLYKHMCASLFQLSIYFEVLANCENQTKIFQYTLSFLKSDKYFIQKETSDDHQQN